MPKQQVNIETDAENPEPIELIAKSIIQVSDAFDKIEKSTATRKLIVLLIQDQTGLPKSTINQILDVVPKLKNHYTKVPAAPVKKK